MEDYFNDPSSKLDSITAQLSQLESSVRCNSCGACCRYNRFKNKDVKIAELTEQLNKCNQAARFKLLRIIASQ